MRRLRTVSRRIADEPIDLVLELQELEVLDQSKKLRVPLSQRAQKRLRHGGEDPSEIDLAGPRRRRLPHRDARDQDRQRCRQRSRSVRPGSHHFIVG
jgi:hypothetical protein